MSDYDYNGLLTPGVWRGKCGQQEIIEDRRSVEEKSKKLAKWIAKSKHFVVFTGAGISTSAGIPDFRGPNGVWTKEEQKKKENKEKHKKTLKTNNIKFQNTLPTITHMALLSLYKLSILKCIISQNIDGLHMVSGIPRDNLSELHGNVYMICCENCGKESLSDIPIPSVGFKKLDNKCIYCNGNMRDCTLDWNDNLPKYDLNLAQKHMKQADLCLCLGSSLQVTPAANLPIIVTKKGNKQKPGKLVLINLQKTPKDGKSNLIIHYYVDEVLSLVLKYLNIQNLTQNRLPMSELKNSFCITRPKDWLQIQLDFNSSEEEEEEEESLDDINDVFDTEDWIPKNQELQLPQKRLLTRVSPRTIKKLCT